MDATVLLLLCLPWLVCLLRLQLYVGSCYWHCAARHGEQRTSCWTHINDVEALPSLGDHCPPLHLLPSHGAGSFQEPPVEAEELMSPDVVAVYPQVGWHREVELESASAKLNCLWIARVHTWWWLWASRYVLSLLPCRPPLLTAPLLVLLPNARTHLGEGVNSPLTLTQHISTLAAGGGSH